MPLGLIGNILVISIHLRKYPKSSYRLYIVWLAITDFTNSCLCMPYLLTHICFPLAFPSEVLCKVGAFITQVASSFSGFILIVIGIHRYRQICRPTEWQISGSQATINCIIAQVLSILVSFPAGFLYGETTVIIRNITGKACSSDDDLVNYNLQGPYYIFVNVIVISNTIVLAILYFFVVKQIRMRQKVHSSSYNETRRSRTTYRTTLTLFTITVTYCFSFIPHTVIRAIEHNSGSLDCHLTYGGGIVVNMILWTFLINSVAYPFIYFYSDLKFRSEVTRLTLGLCGFRRASVGVVTGVNTSKKRSTNGTEQDTKCVTVS